MFDVGFSELLLIGIVALLVLGPERLPKVARTAGLWAGRARRFVASVKSDIEQELKAEELRQIMEQQAKSSGIHEIIEETKEDLEEISKQEYLVKASPKTPPLPTADTSQQKPASGTDHDSKA
jgi:sec-independent protein translocase protein TatB